MAYFEVGKKVVCIDTKFPLADGDIYYPPKMPTKHEILPVAGIYDHERMGLFLCFDKFNTPENNCWFIAKHFRPLEDLPAFSEQIEGQELQERIEMQPVLA